MIGLLCNAFMWDRVGEVGKGMSVCSDAVEVS